MCTFYPMRSQKALTALPFFRRFSWYFLLAAGFKSPTLSRCVPLLRILLAQPSQPFLLGLAFLLSFGRHALIYSCLPKFVFVNVLCTTFSP